MRLYYKVPLFLTMPIWILPALLVLVVLCVWEDFSRSMNKLSKLGDNE